jgi:hypothetical protein
VHVHDEKRSKLNPKIEKCIFLQFSLEHKRYKCLNLSTQKLQVNRDVVFDEMVSWYSLLKIIKDGEAKIGDVSSNVEQESQLINGPQEFSINGCNNTPWKGILRSLNIIHGNFQTSSRNSHVDNESSDSKKSMDEESKTLSIFAPKVQMAKKTLKTLDNNSGIRKTKLVWHH